MAYKLAIRGGEPIIKEKFKRYCSISSEEKDAAVRVINSGCLSNFYGSNNERFYGGEEVKTFEKEWSNFFGVNYAVALNSATSGLCAAVGALSIGPGDEVIVPPYSMSATVMPVLFYGAIPVFVDIEKDFFGINPDLIENKITSRTKAIIITHLFGHPAKIHEIIKIAKKHKLLVIEDCAQSPGARCLNKYVGTFGDIGVFSLNCHKVINTGEGGICITNDEEIKKRLCLIRNHAESVIGGGMKVKNLINMIGFNFRMGELEAAIGKEQLKKLEYLNSCRIELSNYLNEKLKAFSFINTPVVGDDYTHVWYTYSLGYDCEKSGISRNTFVAALALEGAPFYAGYGTPLYLLPVFQNLVALNGGCPFYCQLNKESNINYSRGICPVCEHVEYNCLIQSEQIRPPLTKNDIDNIYSSFEKVINNVDELKSIENNFDVLPDSLTRRGNLL